MNNIYTTEKMVRDCLTKNKMARSNDMMLYIDVLYDIEPSLIEPQNLMDSLVNAPRYGIPSYATVERCARKVKNAYPELKPELKIQTARENLQTDFIEYALNK